MVSDFNTIRHILPKLGRGNYNTLMRLLHNSLTFDISDAAKYRLYVLDYYYRYGWRATIDAFKIGKSTLYDRKDAFERSGKRISSLVPVSTRPKRVRVMTVNPKIVEFIKSVRTEYGNVSKYKLKVFVDEYTKEIGVNPVSTSLIGKVIKRKNFFFERRKRSKKKRFKLLYPRLKKSPHEVEPGYLEMDSITIFVLGERYYFITAIDVVTKYAWAKIVKSLTSYRTKLSLIRFIKEYQYKVRAVQTDNGHEFLKDFDNYLTSNNIIHHFIYQKRPEVNCVIERFNRTIQEEFIERQYGEIYSTKQFTEKLKRYLIWYNTKRPHYSLNYRTPMQYLDELTNFPKCM